MHFHTKDGSLHTLADGYARPRNNFHLIRLFAAWLVIYGHSYPVTGHADEPDLLLRLVQIKFAGAIAVDMFFVISGFLIAASLERNRLTVYLGARVLRIFPAMAVCLLLSVFVLGPLLTTDPGYWQSPQTWAYLWKNLVLKRTEYFLPGVFGDLPSAAINGSLWTLPVEFRLYLVLAVLSLLGLFRRNRFNVLFVAIAVAAWFRYGGQPIKPSKLDLIWCSAFFMTGTLAWFNRDRIALSWPILLAVLGAAAMARGGDFYRPAYFLALAYTTLFLAFVPKLPQIRHTDLSYGVYLYGWPSQQLVQHFAPGGPAWNTLWATLLAGTLAWLSWRVIEQPALRLKGLWAARAPQSASAPTDPAPASGTAR